MEIKPRMARMDTDQTNAEGGTRSGECGNLKTERAGMDLAAGIGTEPGLTVSWESVTNRRYFLERGTNLDAGYSMPDAGFSIVATNIPGQFGMTSYTDTNAVGSRFLYYRVGVQE